MTHRLDYSPPPHDSPVARIQQFVADYFWFVLKNIIGWLLILSAGPIGVAIPGPGGIPLFLLGFALITFPGKRRLAARVLRGKPLDLYLRPFTLLKLAVSLLLPVGLFWYGAIVDLEAVAWLVNHPLMALGVYAAAVALTWILAHQTLRFGNLLVRGMPRARRIMRPWLRRHGVHLLPPRRRRRHIHGQVGQDDTVEEGEIVELHERHYARLRRFWHAIRKHLRFTVGLTLMALIIFMMLRPIYEKWDQVRDRMLATALADLLIPGVIFTIMFALFLFVFRALVWRSMLQGFGFRLPMAPAMRIWSYSELARYIPGSIFQVIGRAYMIKPYGIPGTISSTVQLLELTLFLLANVALAVLCLAWFGIKQLEGQAEVWMWVAIALVPALGLLVHPSIYYRLVNAILKRIGKPPIVVRLDGWKMLLLLGWTFIGLLWQAGGVYIVAAAPLPLEPSKWWVVAGAYSLAWVAGFLAVFSSAGMGVRELVFGGVMLLIIPAPVRTELGDASTILATMYFIAFLLRLWSIAGELLFAGIATLVDYRGVARQLSDAPQPPPGLSVVGAQPARHADKA